MKNFKCQMMSLDLIFLSSVPYPWDPNIKEQKENVVNLATNILLGGWTTHMHEPHNDGLGVCALGEVMVFLSFPAVCHIEHMQRRHSDNTVEGAQ